MKIKECGECLMHLYGKPFLREAFSSVAIEHAGVSSYDLAVAYLSEYHNNGHVEPDDEDVGDEGA